MKTRLIRRWSILVLLAATAGSAAAQQRDWRAAAAKDLQAIHDGLQANSAAPFAGEQGATFREWLDQGLAQAKRQLPRVQDERSELYLLYSYVSGFRDSHIGVRPTHGSQLSLAPIAWPGFVTSWRDGHYFAALGESATTPPAGARLVSCDGKSADQIARDRLDRYESNLMLTTGRYITAWKLLVDTGNPFVPEPPRSCTFDVAGHTRSFHLHYEPLDAGIATKLSQLTAPVPGTLGLKAIGNDRWWLRIPSMGGDQDWDAFYADVRAHLAQLRSAPLLVVDVRGNGGGDSSYADRLARILWGEKLVEAREPDEGDVLWRVSPRNRQFLVDVIDEYQKDPGAADSLTYYSDLLKRMDAAIARHAPTFIVHNPPSSPKWTPVSPMRGRIVLLTDYTCNSACLDLMDLFLRLPGTIQAGTETSADTIFMEVTRVPLASEELQLILGHKAILGRPRKSNQTYKPLPQYTYHGDPHDDAAVRQWVLSKFR